MIWSRSYPVAFRGSGNNFIPTTLEMFTKADIHETVRPGMVRSLAVLLVLLGGCATSPGDAEAEREIVLRYLDANVGTAGPFSKHGKKELDILSAPDRAAALALLERGAVGFLVYVPEPAAAAPAPDAPAAAAKPAASVAAARIIILLHGKVVGDYRGVKS